MPFRERREPVPGGSLSNVLFSRVPEGHNTDPLRGKIPAPRVIASAEPFYEAGVLCERAQPAKGSAAPGRVLETLILPMFGTPYRRRGAMVVPSGIAQAVPGRSHLAIPGQIGPTIAPLTGQRNRHGSEPPPGPFNFPRSAGIGCAHPGPYLARDGQIRAYRDVLAACPGWAHPIPVRALWREKPLESCRQALLAFRGLGPLPPGPQGYYSAILVVGPARSLGLTLISSAGSRVRLLSSATSMAIPVSRPK